MDDETFHKEAALHVCRLLDGFQKEYEANTSGCKMPGNDLYSEKLMVIVEEARAAMATPSPGSAAPAALCECPCGCKRPAKSNTLAACRPAYRECDWCDSCMHRQDPQFQATPPPAAATGLEDADHVG